MTNADKFQQVFGIYATELWAMPEKEFLEWLNSEVGNCSEFPNILEKYRELKHIVADWKSAIRCSNADYYTGYMSALSVVEGMIAEVETNNEEG